MSSFFSPIKRVGRICGVGIRLRQPAAIGLMEKIEDPRQFAEMAMIASGRHLALAAAFLPDEPRLEGMLAFLLCRVLDAYEDLSPSPEYAISALQRTVAGLAEKEEIPPLSADLVPRNESDAVESLLASKLELLRQLLISLPEQSQSRVLDLVSRMASAMEASLRNRSAGSKGDLNLYCDSVLGNATSYAFRILTGQEPYERGRKAAGRLLHIANYLRDLEQDHASGHSPTAGALQQVRNELTLQALQEAPHVPQLLFSTRFPRYCGSRGALAIIAATTTRFYLRQIRGRVPRSFLRTLWIGISCTFSASAYCKLIQQLDAAILDSLSPGNGEAVTSALKPHPRRLSVRRTAYHQQVFEYQLALRHPNHKAAEALAAAARLLHCSLDIFHSLPHTLLAENVDGRNLGVKLVAGDLFAISAVSELSLLGNDVVRQFTELTVRLSLHAAASDADGDSSGETAAFLSLVTSLGAGIDLKSAEGLAAQHRGISQRLYGRDRQSFWSRAFRQSAASISHGATP